MELRDKLQEATGHDTRVTILGHINEGHSAADRILGSCMGGGS